MTQYSIGHKEAKVYFNIQPLAFPKYQSIDILEYDIFENIINEIQELLKSYELKYENGVISTKGFIKLNIKKFNNIKKIIKNNQIENKSNVQKHFLYFLNQCIIRNKKNYSDFFVDENYKNFFSKIKKNNSFIINLKKDFLDKK